MWSVGCILAELLGRKPLFPGKNFVHQLQLIFDVIGSPQTEDVERIKNKQARKFLDSVQNKVKVPFDQLFSSSHALAATVLETLLLFNSSERATAAELLNHKYFRNLCYAELPRKDPAAPFCDFTFERENLSPTELRNKISQEVADFDVEPQKHSEAVKTNKLDQLQNRVQAAVTFKVPSAIANGQLVNSYMRDGVPMERPNKKATTEDIKTKPSAYDAHQVRDITQKQSKACIIS